MFEDLDEAWQNERLTRSRRHAFDQEPCDEECANTGARWRIHPFVLVVVIVVLVGLSIVGIWRTLGGAWPWSGAGGQRTNVAQSGAYALEVYEWEEQNAGSGSDTGVASVENSSEEGKIYVYVTGAVTSPGLYELAEGERVAKAIELAGNLTAEADTTAINLARVATDGEHLHIPKVGETASGSETSTSSGNTNSSGSSNSGSSVDSCINLNSASASELEELDGIGPTLASRIVEFREENGAFTSVEQVDAVSGIGPSLVQRISKKACV